MFLIYAGVVYAAYIKNLLQDVVNSLTGNRQKKIMFIEKR